MQRDLFIIILGLILILAMVLTLLYGKEYSRHGYGAMRTASQKEPLVAAYVQPDHCTGLRSPLQNSITIL